MKFVMKDLSIYCLAVILIAAGCSKYDETQIPEATEDCSPVFSVGLENEMTRTFLDEDAEMFWSAEDHISVFYPNFFNRKYRFDGETGDKEGTFSAVASDQKNQACNISVNYAVYPYSKDVSVSDEGLISVTLPSEQTYVPGSFGPEANTMVAVTEDRDDYFLPFKNLCGYLKIKLYGNVEVKSLKLEGNAGELISGSAMVTAEYGNTPDMTMGEDAGTSITLICDNQIRLGSTPNELTEFWFVVPPTDFEKGFTISLSSSEGMCSIKTEKSYSIKRNSVLSMTAAAMHDYSLPANNMIWYTTDDESIITPTSGFEADIISNTYSNGRGIMLFSGDINKIPSSAFEGNIKLTSIVLPNSITAINNYAFEGCTSLTSIQMQEGVNSIGYCAFYNCSSLKDIVIPDSVTSIESYSFYGCGSMESIEIPSSVTSIGSYAFQYCTGELTVNCDIPYEAFGNAYFTKVVIGEGVKTILESIGTDRSY